MNADLEAIKKRDAETSPLWITGPASFTAQAARDRRALLQCLSDSIRERDEARALVDPYVCDLMSNESGEEDGWREIDTQPGGMEAELRYAATRGLIERDPARQARFRFTDAGKELL